MLPRHKRRDEKKEKRERDREVYLSSRPLTYAPSKLDEKHVLVLRQKGNSDHNLCKYSKNGRCGSPDTYVGSYREVHSQQSVVLSRQLKQTYILLTHKVWLIKRYCVKYIYLLQFGVLRKSKYITINPTPSAFM